MAPKLNKLKSPPKSSTLPSAAIRPALNKGKGKGDMAPLAATNVTTTSPASLSSSPSSSSGLPRPDPFAPKRSALGAITPEKKVENIEIVDTEDQVTCTTTGELRDVVAEREEEERVLLEKEKELREAAAMEEAQQILAEEIRLEEEQETLKNKATGIKDLQIDTKITTNEEEKANDILDEEELIDEHKLMQDDDEFQEATLLATQEARINQILNKKAKNNMSAYQQPLSAISIDVPLLRAVFKDDIDTVKKYLSEDFPDCASGRPEDSFLSVRDSRGRSALHVAAAGDSPLMVEYLLTHSRVCLEKLKHSEMQKIKEERKNCLMELKMSMKKSFASAGKGKQASKLLSDSFSKNDYRVASIEKWFEGEVARIHRKVELLTEAQWLSGLLLRDRQGLSPLHYAVQSGTLEVLRALLCVPPFYSGRGVFCAAQKQQEMLKLTRSGGRRKGNTDKPYEWFKVGGVYNAVTGEEVAVVHKFKTDIPHINSTFSAKECDDIQIKNKLTLHDVAQVSSFNAYISPVLRDGDDDDVPKSKVDYDIVVPWLVRNLYRRSVDMGKKLGATAMDVLEEMVEMVNPYKGRVLILPEIREWLRYLGIVVTTDVIKELCNIYPAPAELVEEKYKNYRDKEDDMLLSDSKSFSSKFPNAEKFSKKQSSKTSESKMESEQKNSRYDDRDAGTKRSPSSKNGSSKEIDEEPIAMKRSLFDPDSEEATFGLALDLLFDDIASGQGMKSIFSETVLITEKDESLKLGDETDNEHQHESNGVRSVKSQLNTVSCDTFQMPAVVSVSNIKHYRRILLNCRDGAGNSALLVAAALGKLHHLEELISHGADISVQSLDHQTPLTMAKNTSIIGVLQRELVAKLKSKRTDMLMGNVALSKSSESLHVSKDFVDTIKSTPNEATVQSTCGNNQDDVVLQLHDLKTKRWAYSQSALTWAVEGGMTDVIDKMLSQGIDANEVDISGRSPLHVCMYLASQASDADALLSLRRMIESILNNGGDINATTISGKTPLHEIFFKNKSPHMEILTSQEKMALNRLRATIVRSMLQWGADPLKPDRQGYTSLYYCSKENMSACMIEMLKLKHIDVYFQDPRGRTVLHTACIFGSEAVASIIVNYDADYATGIQCIKDKDGKTAKNLISPHLSTNCLITLWQACRLGNSARVSSILVKEKKKEQRATYENVEEEQAARNPLDVTSGQEDGNKDLWLLGGVDCKTRIHKWTPLHATVIGWAEFVAVKSKKNGNSRAMKHGEKGSRGKVAGKNSFRNSKVSYPASLTVASFSTIISMLIQNFAYIDSLECKCRTPLMLAAAFDLPEAVSLLCSAGADVNMRDLDGNTALHYAYACSSSHAMSALEDNNAHTDIANNAGNTPFDVIGLIDTISPIFK